MTWSSFSDRAYEAFLFDMDGTLLDSTAVVERVWGRWAMRHGLDPAVLTPTIHGVRAVDVFARLALPGIDPHVEATAIQEEELDDVEGIEPVAGATEFLNALPRDRWAVVTSAPIELARKRMRVAGIPFPKLIVSGEDVENGKPDPTCYRLAASRLGFEACRCLVFEDAMAGVLAAEAAACDVVVITATHGRPLPTKHSALSDYSALRFEQATDGLISLRHTVSQ